MSATAVLTLCGLSFAAGAFAFLLFALWLARGVDESAEQQQRAAELELQRRSYAAMVRLLNEARRHGNDLPVSQR